MNSAKYPLFSILTGQYTHGNQFRFVYELEPYIGLYHVLPNGERWSGDIPSDDSKLLITISSTDSNTTIKYNQLNNIIQIPRETPIPYYPIITHYDYTIGYIYRCFVQKVNNPENTIIEISPDQFNQITSQNKQQGINPVIWNHIQIKWYLDKELGVSMNSLNINEAAKKFKGLEKYLINNLEFCR